MLLVKGDGVDVDVDVRKVGCSCRGRIQLQRFETDGVAGGSCAAGCEIGSVVGSKAVVLVNRGMDAASIVRLCGSRDEPVELRGGPSP